jgi:WD40 repeat protein
VTLHGNGDLQEMAISPDGKLLAVFAGRHIRIWDCPTHRLKFVLDGHLSGGYGLDFSPDSRYLISGSYDQTFKLWNLDRGQCTLTFHGYEETIYSCKFLSDRSLLIGTAQGLMRFYDFGKQK